MVEVKTYSSRRLPLPSYDAGQIDAFAAYCADNDRCYHLEGSLATGRKAVTCDRQRRGATGAPV